MDEGKKGAQGSVDDKRATELGSLAPINANAGKKRAEWQGQWQSSEDHSEGAIT